jgi:hypothetical protein
MFHAFGNVGSNIPALDDIQAGKYDSHGWSGPGQRRNSKARRDSDIQVLSLYRSRTMETIPEPKKAAIIDEKTAERSESVLTPQTEENLTIAPHDPSVPYENGYQWLLEICHHAIWLHSHVVRIEHRSMGRHALPDPHPRHARHGAPILQFLGLRRKEVA